MGHARMPVITSVCIVGGSVTSFMSVPNASAGVERWRSIQWDLPIAHSRLPELLTLAYRYVYFNGIIVRQSLYIFI